jgi:hypothetical protein
VSRDKIARRIDRSVRHDPPRSLALIVIAVVAISAVVLGLDRVTSRRPSTVSNSPSPAPNATIESTPTPVPLSVAPCSPDDVAVFAGGWGGATGSMAGGASLINVSVEPCSIVGKPAVDLLASDGTLIAKGTPASPGPVGVLVPGGLAGVITVWSNWCGETHPRDLVLRLSLLDWDRGLLAPVVIWRQPGVVGGPGPDSVPRCDTPTAPSAIGVPEPWALPGPFEPNVVAEPCAAEALAGFLGPWGAGLGNLYANAAVLNIGGVDCLLPASPLLELRDGSGKLLVTGEPWADAESPLVLPAGWSAIARIAFANWCVASPALPLRFDLIVGGERLPIAPASERAVVAPPSCNSGLETPPPLLGYDAPFTVPGLTTTGY